ncbi:release factor glutamine methyltransferase [Thalassotalea insulae]|uniref:Release factor glutamine methyltransferase n=1 Tax=Thalassotalea insulae TaxID=2056778 RepID=A0ABQ6GWB2_9GAMM|nr:peptide chain release factor N(5)-glutamine methyltransferase [Thalassotalea insulae]GLX79964.1 release factor glutamine methyltransferase [Thalassotalea insulae]
MSQYLFTSIAEAVDYSTRRLASLSDSAKLDGQILLAQVLDKELSYLYTWPEKQVTAQQQAEFLKLLALREQGQPIAYITGYKEFWSLNFKVSPATLIPRPDTEVLVELILDNHPQSHLACLDLGTGTGAIALALASERQHWSIDAVDYSEQAVALAQENARQLSLTQVNIFQSDWFGNVPEGKRYQLIVSNPPYIDASDKHLAQGDVRFEPKSALVADNSGLADIADIINQSQNFLAPQGMLYFEHGFEQAKAVRQLFADAGYQNIQTMKDYNANDRITYACYN